MDAFRRQVERTGAHRDDWKRAANPGRGPAGGAEDGADGTAAAQPLGRAALGETASGCAEHNA